MNTLTNCPNCASDHHSVVQANISSFLHEYVFKGRQQDVNYRICRHCGFVFYDLRMTENQLNTLYGTYRTKDYLEVRERVEPGYSKVNALIGNNNLEIASRTKNLNQILKQYIDTSKVNSVLDFGGDRGQFIPECLQNADRYVFEVSDQQPLEGIKRLADYSEQSPYNFVMCCHTLEHVNSPIEVLEQLKSITSPDGFVYIELPMDLSVITFVDLLLGSGISKFKQFHMHEHINFFTSQSLHNLLTKMEFDVKFCQSIVLDFGWTRMPVISALAQVRNTHLGESPLLCKYKKTSWKDFFNVINAKVVNKLSHKKWV